MKTHRIRLFLLTLVAISCMRSHSHADTTELAITPSSKDSISVYTQSGPGSFNSIAIQQLKEKLLVESGKNLKIIYSNGTPKDALMLAEENQGLAFFALQNKISGMVKATIEALQIYDFDVIERITIDIEMALSCTPKTTVSNIKRIFGHPQALLQVSWWVRSQDHPIKLVEVLEGAAKAGEVVASMQEKHACVVGPRALGQEYKLHVIATNIQNEKNNFTEFALARPYKRKNPISKSKAAARLRLMQGSPRSI